MTNWFETNPTKTIITYTILIAATMWGITTFVLDKNKTEKHETTVKMLNAKIEYLETENSKLQKENDKYLSWLLGTNNTIPYLENELVEIEKENEKLKNEIIANSIEKPGPTKTDTVNTQYEYTQKFKKGESFVDPLTNAIIGISGIDIDYTANLLLSLPNQQSKSLDHIRPGTSWEFFYQKDKFIISITRIDWITSEVEAKIRKIVTK